MKLLVVLSVFLLFPAPAFAQKEQVRIGSIEYFGTKGIDIEKVNAALASYEGYQLTFDAMPDLISKVQTSLKEATGMEPTDVAPTCCDSQNNLLLYVGLPGQNLKSSAFNAVPTGSVSFPPSEVTLYYETMEQLFAAVRIQASEDRSKGYALSAYPPLRAKQLAMREYAVHHFQLIRDVLAHSSDTKQRIVAAQLMGYTKQSRLQINSLVRASHDREETVRNNAVRALGVLGESNQRIANQIPPAGYIGMLSSGIWTDRNKGTWLLEILTKNRDRHLLRSIGQQAAYSLIEMARWDQWGHAVNARLILGRIAGIEEKRLYELSKSDPEQIINAFLRHRLRGAREEI